MVLKSCNPNSTDIDEMKEMLDRRIIIHRMTVVMMINIMLMMIKKMLMMMIKLRRIILNRRDYRKDGVTRQMMNLSMMIKLRRREI